MELAESIAVELQRSTRVVVEVRAVFTAATPEVEQQLHQGVGETYRSGFVELERLEG